MKLKDYVFAAGIILAIVVGVNFPIGGQTIVEKTIEKVGAAGQDFPGPCISVNGQVRCAETRKLSVATTTPFASKSPAATSTLDTNATGCRFDTSSTTASVVTFAKATTPFATTTLIGQRYAIAANAAAAIAASTTATQFVAATQVFAPNTWFVMSMEGGTGTFSPTGQCSAVFNVL